MSKKSRAQRRRALARRAADPRLAAAARAPLRSGGDEGGGEGERGGQGQRQGQGAAGGAALGAQGGGVDKHARRKRKVRGGEGEPTGSNQHKSHLPNNP